MMFFREQKSRRDFVKALAAFPAAVILMPIIQSYVKKRTPPAMSKVVRVTDTEATDNTGGKDNTNLNPRVVQNMIDAGIKQFTGQESIEEGWKQIIPNAKKKVAIKVNCQVYSIYTKSKIVNAVTVGLIRRGVSPSNIVIYDLTDKAFSLAGLKKNFGSGIKVGKNSEYGGYSWLYWTDIPRLYKGCRFSKVIAGEGKFGCDYLINIPVLKALDGYSGVSISMKNHFGSISNCDKLHSTIQDSLAELNAHDLIVNKTRLIIVDGIFTEYKWVNGRSQNFVDITNQILIGTDPVAIDHLGWQTIEKLRKKHGLNSIQPKPTFIQKAARNFGLGNNDMQKIDLIDI